MGTSKRKRTVKVESEEHSDTETAAKKLKTAPPPKVNKKGRGRPSKADGLAYTEEQDAFLAETIRNHGEKKNWKEVAKLWTEKFPESKKSQDTLRMRYNNTLKGNDVELDDDEKEVFKRAVEDIQKQKIVHEAIAWRYNQLLKEPKDPNKPMTKTGVVKLMKAMKNWSFDSSSSEITTTPRKSEDENAKTRDPTDGETENGNVQDEDPNESDGEEEKTEEEKRKPQEEEKDGKEAEEEDGEEEEEEDDDNSDDGEEEEE